MIDTDALDRALAGMGLGLGIDPVVDAYEDAYEDARLPRTNDEDVAAFAGQLAAGIPTHTGARRVFRLAPPDPEVVVEGPFGAARAGAAAGSAAAPPPPPLPAVPAVAFETEPLHIGATGPLSRSARDIAQVSRSAYPATEEDAFRADATTEELQSTRDFGPARAALRRRSVYERFYAPTASIDVHGPMDNVPGPLRAPLAIKLQAMRVPECTLVPLHMLRRHVDEHGGDPGALVLTWREWTTEVEGWGIKIVDLPASTRRTLEVQTTQGPVRGAVLSGVVTEYDEHSFMLHVVFVVAPDVHIVSDPVECRFLSHFYTAEPIVRRTSDV